MIAHGIGYTGRAMYIELRFLAIQDLVDRRTFILQYCPSSKNRADCLSKQLGPHAAQKNRKIDCYIYVRVNGVIVIYTIALATFLTVIFPFWHY